MLDVQRVELKEILSLRTLYLQEWNCQIRYHACHERQWTDSYAILSQGRMVGYGSVKGLEDLKQRNAIFEFYLLPHERQQTSRAYAVLIDRSGCVFAESQTNDLLTTSMVYAFCDRIFSPVTLFGPGIPPDLTFDGVVFRTRQAGDDVFGKAEKDCGMYVLDADGEIVADGGFLLHYNEPFADLYMEVAPPRRRQGLGSFLIQELAKACYQAGRLPSARCNVSNHASRRTLQRGGLQIVGTMVRGMLKQPYASPIWTADG